MHHLTQNLCAVVARAPSVADFCRRTGINRQQFNKYLAGTHVPSQRSMLKIAEVCGLSMQDFLLAPEHFVALLQGQGQPAAAPVAATGAGDGGAGSPHFRTLEAFARASVPGLKPFLGSYFRYHHSSIFPGWVIRAVTVIYQDDGVVRYATVEHMPALPEEGQEACRFSYRGVCYLMGSRVFMSDFEHRQLNEMTATILMPQFRTPIRTMFGVLSGIAATSYGQPFATRVAFERKNDDTVIRKAMVRQATMLLPTDPQIPGALRRYLGEPAGAVLMARE
jgi:transcriptional regulator with XRE-family HTH domain